MASPWFLKSARMKGVMVCAPSMRFTSKMFDRKRHDCNLQHHVLLATVVHQLLHDSSTSELLTVDRK
jgi:hypothetical protein